MPETGYIEEYEQGTGRLLRREPYEVSDEELAKDREDNRKANILTEIDDLVAKVDKLVGVKGT